MKTVVNFRGYDFEVKSNIATVAAAFPYCSDRRPVHYRFSVGISSEVGYAYFPFYGSEYDFNRGKNTMNPADLLGAFSCILSDAMAGDRGYADFCREFGYDENPRGAQRVYTGCVKTLEKIKGILPAGVTVYELFDAVCDAINER